jgi:hypothetical protein
LLSAAGAIALGACASDEGDLGDVPSTSTAVTTAPAGSSPPAAKSTGTPATSSADRDDVEDAVRDALGAQSSGDVDEFLRHWTDRGLQAEFGATRDEVRASEGEGFQQELNVESFRNTTVSGNIAGTEVDIESGGALFNRKLALVRQDDRWMIDNSTPGLATVPQGTLNIPVQMNEFRYVADTAAFKSGDPVAVTARNTGVQPHEIVMFKLDDDVDLASALRSDEPPSGVEFIAFTSAAPGQEANFVTQGDLDAGRYAMVCFLPDTADSAGASHFEKGMVLEFRVR